MMTMNKKRITCGHLIAYGLAAQKPTLSEVLHEDSVTHEPWRIFRCLQGWFMAFFVER